MRRILASLSVIGVAAFAVYMGGTGAFFSDTETSQNNIFQAGDIDLQIGNESYAIDWNIPNYASPSGEFVENPNNTWELADLTIQRFFDFVDLKPGDYGEDTIEVQVGSNDAWVCAAAQITDDNDNTYVEPELADDSTVGGDPLTTDGELDEEVNFAFWVDDGDNVFEDDESIFLGGPLSNLDNAGQIALADSNSSILGGTEPIPGNTSFFIGKMWCFGELTPNQVAQDGFGDVETPLTAGTGFLCDGSEVNNAAQTDQVVGDLAFYAEQSRNNEQFSCDNVDFGFDEEPEEQPQVGAVLGGYSIPDEQNDCDVVVADSDDLQVAIDNASEGATVCIEDGEYNEFTVDKPLTIAGLVNPTASATIVPSAANVQQLALVESSDVTIKGLHFDGSAFDFTGGQLAGVRIAQDGGSIDNVNITYNKIENLKTIAAAASSKGIQWHDDNSGNSLTNSSFMHNMISNIESTNKGGYGIQTVGDTDGLMISYNTVSNVTGSWGAGVAIDGLAVVSNTDTNIKFNQLETSIIADLSVQVEQNADADGVFVNMNNLVNLVHGGGNPFVAGTGTVDAENNWWGDLNPADNVLGPVDFDPYEASAFPTI